LNDPLPVRTPRWFSREIGTVPLIYPQEIDMRKLLLATAFFLLAGANFANACQVGNVVIVTGQSSKYINLEYIVLSSGTKISSLGLSAALNEIDPKMGLITFLEELKAGKVGLRCCGDNCDRPGIVVGIPAGFE
jgi:hypothetical protein